MFLVILGYYEVLNTVYKKCQLALLLIYLFNRPIYDISR